MKLVCAKAISCSAFVPLTLALPQSLRLAGSLAWTGDTRPIPEQLARFAGDGELIAHDCGLHGNPSHTGVDDLEREYDAATRARMVVYHYASAADGQALRARGLRVAEPGQVLALAEPTAARAG